jgi:hypothetical protein
VVVVVLHRTGPGTEIHLDVVRVFVPWSALPAADELQHVEAHGIGSEWTGTRRPLVLRGNDPSGTAIALTGCRKYARRFRLLPRRGERDPGAKNNSAENASEITAEAGRQ